ncbi:neutral zinc metallopeptidase [Nonomuraea sp. NPDC050310]|uniref:neutral zinc metallopeptidase n=1 Tax=Nonomuraea sp. NPDC050310 TaxID=3154935 RepID=UPI0033E1BFA4
MLRRLPLLAAAGSLVVLLPAGPAAAARDPLAGKPPATACRTPALTQGGVTEAEPYARAVLKCLERAWSAHFKRAGASFARPKVLYLAEPRSEICGGAWPEGAWAFYCIKPRTLVLPLFGPWIEGREDLFPLKVMAHEYGHHLQRLAGIWSPARPVAKPKALEFRRRYELQADCLAGAFLGSVWASTGGTAADWAALVEESSRGDWLDDQPTHGSGKTRGAWLKRGFAGGSCDTWSAPAAKIT